jgi:transposase
MEEAKVKKRRRPKKTKIQILLVRLRDFQNETLPFMYDLEVPFDNNLAERDIRVLKVQQKVSGLLRSMAGAEQFCRIHSFISTVKKQGLNVIESIYQITTGKQIYLDFLCKIAE